MLTHEQRAHDLAILYMQLEIKEGKITTSTPADLQSFTNDYQYLHDNFLDQLQNP